MGFWNVQAKDLRLGDEIRVTTTGGAEYLTVEAIDPQGDDVELRLAWGSHIALDAFTNTLPRDKKLTVRR